ncbi:vanadium-dependent haloperoxidase [Marinicrinis sediminis]|uniref:Vanadium-dependent haloperoxidase n=1 Tax=Marinicrinis sediminis TaxID=1652465 RepID=A0ABW5RE74_9BACL
MENKKDANSGMADLHAFATGPLPAVERRDRAIDYRTQTAMSHQRPPLPHHVCNGDEMNYANKIGSFSKTLPHNAFGEVDLDAYYSFLRALTTGQREDYEAIPMGGTRKLANPQAAYCYDLVGADCHQMLMPTPPAFSSAWNAAEMAEDYWRALTRDVSFAEYDQHPLIQAAVCDLNRFSDYRGPRAGKDVTSDVLFRGETPGDQTGPFISQFLWKDIPYGSAVIPQRYAAPVADQAFMTTQEEWLHILNGGAPAKQTTFGGEPRYIHNGRDLAEFVHHDFTYQSCLSACLMLLQYGQKALDPANPYLSSHTQGGFVSFGAAHILDFVARSARAALEAAWFQKFLVHRRLRPEAFAGRVHQHVTGRRTYPIHDDLLASEALKEVYNRYGSYFLPMAYPEGSPTHPAYPAGHACIAGAGVTMLKVFFHEDMEIEAPVMASADGSSLEPYTATELTIGGELNKLASNIALGRDTAGVHWRTDGVEGLKLGESVAIHILQDYKESYPEAFSGFTFTSFDGTKLTL